MWSLWSEYLQNNKRRCEISWSETTRGLSTSPTRVTLTVVCVAVIESPRCRGVSIFILLLVLTIHV